MSILTIARLTFREAASRRILLAALVLGLIFLLVFGTGFHLILNEGQREGTNIMQLQEAYNFLLMAGLYVINFLTVMMTVLTSVDTLSGEINSGTIQTLVAKPVRRRDVFLGKWLGFVGMITLYLLLMGGGVMAIVYVRTGYLAPNPGLGLAMMWLNTLVLLSVSLLGGTRLSTLANGVLVFGLYGIAFIGGWIEQIGSLLPGESFSQSAMNIGVITSLILPSEALWKRAAYELQSPLVASLGISPFSGSTHPSNMMVGYALVFLLGTVLLAIHWFNKRDL